MSLTPTALSVVAIAAAVIAIVGVLLAWQARRRQADLLQRFRVLWPEGQRDDAVAVLARQAERVRTQSARIGEVETALTSLREDIAQSLRHIAVLRYDAFGDMGGRMSFSVAVIDDRGDGMVLSSIHARGESRTYAKGIVAGRSDVTLTPEEQQALAAARSGETTA